MEGLQQQVVQPKATLGNHSFVSNAVVAYASRTIVQAKLELSEPGDGDEQEADAVADEIVSGGKIRRKISNGSGTGISVSPQVESQIAQLQGGGHAIPEALRHMMEKGFGRDFSQVRLHTDAQAAEMSSSISAKAFTHGNDIFFNRDQFSPNTSEGQKLVAHELAHVVQGTEKVGRVKDVNESSEYDNRIIILEELKSILIREKEDELIHVYYLLDNIDEDTFYSFLCQNIAIIRNYLANNLYVFETIYTKKQSCFTRLRISNLKIFNELIGIDPQDDNALANYNKLWFADRKENKTIEIFDRNESLIIAYKGNMNGIGVNLDQEEYHTNLQFLKNEYASLDGSEIVSRLINLNTYDFLDFIMDKYKEPDIKNAISDTLSEDVQKLWRFHKYALKKIYKEHREDIFYELFNSYEIEDLNGLDLGITFGSQKYRDILRSECRVCSDEIVKLCKAIKKWKEKHNSWVDGLKLLFSNDSLDLELLLPVLEKSIEDLNVAQHYERIEDISQGIVKNGIILHVFRERYLNYVRNFREGEEDLETAFYVTKTVAYAILCAVAAPETIMGSVALGAFVGFEDSSFQEIIKGFTNQSDGIAAAGGQILKSTTLGGLGGAMGASSNLIPVKSIMKDAAIGTISSFTTDYLGGESGFPQELRGIGLSGNTDFRVLVYIAAAEGGIEFDEKKKLFIVTADGDCPKKNELVKKLNEYLD